MTKDNTLKRRHFMATSSAAAAAAGLSASTAAVNAAAQPRKKKVLIALGEFCEALETYYMIFRLREAGVIPVVGSKSVKRLQLVVHDFEPAYEGYTEKLGYQVDVDLPYEHVDPAGFDGVLIPGGRGPEEMRQDPHLMKIVNHFMDNNLPLGAMCHGVMVLYTERDIRGRAMTAYYGIRADIERLGGRFVDQAAVVDKKMVTSRGWPDLPEFMQAFLKVLGA